MLLFSITPHFIVYIDPGTGSIILQAVVATVAGAAIAVKLFWHRIARFFGHKHDIESDPSDKPGDREA